MNLLIDVENINYTIPFGKEILKNVSFQLNEGELMGVLGRNGVGKTTLIDLLLGNRNASNGTIKILGENPVNSKRTLLSSICFLSQDVSLKSTLSVKEFLRFYAEFYPSYNLREENELLDYFSLTPNQQLASLSTGQQKKVQIVAAISASPKIILVDEITAVLDPDARNQFFKILLKAKQTKGLSIILATNIAEDLIERADKVLLIDEGCGKIEHPENILTFFNVKQSA